MLIKKIRHEQWHFHDINSSICGQIIKICIRNEKNFEYKSNLWAYSVYHLEASARLTVIEAACYAWSTFFHCTCNISGYSKSYNVTVLRMLLPPLNNQVPSKSSSTLRFLSFPIFTDKKALGELINRVNFHEIADWVVLIVWRHNSPSSPIVIN